MPEQILTAAEEVELGRLNTARTQGEWTYKLRHGGNPHWAYLHTGRKEHDTIPTEDAEFAVAVANSMTRILETIKALKGLLAEATDWGHTQNCWKTPCTCGYDSWLKKVEKILEGEDDHTERG